MKTFNKGETFKIGSTVYTVVREKSSEINGDMTVIASYTTNDGYEDFYQFNKAEIN